VADSSAMAAIGAAKNRIIVSPSKKSIQQTSQAIFAGFSQATAP
jgi:hypothetical protein